MGIQYAAATLVVVRSTKKKTLVTNSEERVTNNMAVLQRHQNIVAATEVLALSNFKEISLLKSRESLEFCFSHLYFAKCRCPISFPTMLSRFLSSSRDTECVKGPSVKIKALTATRVQKIQKMQRIKYFISISILKITKNVFQFRFLYIPELELEPRISILVGSFAHP